MREGTAPMPRILIIDDEQMNRDLLRECLERRTYEVSEVDSGIHALEAVARQQPDLVLCDVKMPGMDGFEITRRLKQSSPDEFLPIIMVSGMLDHDARVRGLQAGADDFL